MVPHPPIPSIAASALAILTSSGTLPSRKPSTTAIGATVKRSGEIQLGCREHEDQYERSLVHMQGEPQKYPKRRGTRRRPFGTSSREPGEQHHVDRGTFGVAPMPTAYVE